MRVALGDAWPDPTWRARLPSMSGERRPAGVPAHVVEQHLVAGERADMGDAVAHLAGPDHADLASVSLSSRSPSVPRGASIPQARRKRKPIRRDALVGERRSALFQLLLQLRQDLEQIANEPVIRDLEDRRFGVLIDGDDDLGVLMPAICWIAPEMPRRCKGRVDGLAGLADLHVASRA